MDEICLPREDKGDLVFKGAMLSHASSKRRGALRWSELWIYAAMDPQAPYVLAGVGASLVPGEDNIYWADRLSSADAMVRRLVKHDNVNDEDYLTRIARRLLEDAGRSDPAIAGLLSSWG